MELHDWLVISAG